MVFNLHIYLKKKLVSKKKQFWQFKYMNSQKSCIIILQIINLCLHTNQNMQSFFKLCYLHNKKNAHPISCRQRSSPSILLGWLVGMMCFKANFCGSSL